VCGGLFLQLHVEHFSGYFFTDWNFSEDFFLNKCDNFQVKG